ncbi:biotin/lipoyl-containing protein, partial [Gordonia sp. i37]|uniref:biotin/lipoyl-containing protein n=1 Tax=Gordonia sp. i37 TaxID=1961707 RepID=UPI0009CFB36D
MAFSVQMPALGESVTEGTVTRWLKEEGDTVEADEPLLEVSTDKVDTEIPAPTSGVLTKIIAQEDDVVEIGGELALIGDAGESADDSGDSGSDDSADSDDSAGGDEPTEAGAAEQDTEAPSTEAEAPAEKPAAATGDSGASGTDVLMPELGESVTEGTVTNWLKAVGDEVAADEPLLEVSTDKVDTEIPSPVAGTLLEILAQEDDVIEVGGKLAVIGDASAAGSKPEPEPEPEPQPEPAKSEPEPAKSEPEPAKSEEAPATSEPEPEPVKVASAAAPADDSTDLQSTPYVTPLVR